MKRSTAARVAAFLGSIAITGLMAKTLADYGLPTPSPVLIAHAASAASATRR